MKQIIVTVAPGGKSTVEAEGFTGTSCQEATKALREALGRQEKEEAKPEMYQGEVKVQEQVRAG